MTDDFDLEDAPMARRTSSSRTSFVVAMIAMLCIGAVVGAALEHAIFRPQWRALGLRHGGGGGGGIAGFIWHGRHGGPPRLMDDRMTKVLSLTPEQRIRVDSIMAQSMRQIRQAQDQIRPQMRQIFQETHARIDSVLTPEQRERLRTTFPRRGRGLDSLAPRP